MTEIEVPIEKIQEDIHHQALHGAPQNKMMSRGALLSAFLAVLAAIAALFAGHYSNEAMILQIQASDQWSYYQAKGIKGSLAALRADFLKDSESVAKAAEYKKEQEEIKIEATKKENESKILLHRHEGLAAAVTFFQVAIGMTAIGILTKRRQFLGFSLVIGISGFVWMLKSFLIH